MKKTEQKILNFISRENLISRGDKILVALSGGPDSVFALKLLAKFKNKFGIDIAAFHLNHLLRGKESDGDEKFCREICKELKIDLITGKADIKKISKQKKTSIEETARKVRYKKLESLAKTRGFTKIVTAHNSNDNAETILLNLFTGCGLHGISGIPVKRGIIIRPLLSLSKEEILDYLKHNKIEYRVDSSNLSDDYKRNYLRNRIIPRLKNEFNPKLEDALFRSSRIFENSKNIIEKLSSNLINELVTYNSGRISIKLDLFEKHEDLAGFVLRMAIESRFAMELTFDDFLLIKGLADLQVGKKVNLSSNLIAQRERGYIELFTGKTDEIETFSLKIGEKIKIGNKIIGISETMPHFKTSKKRKKSEIIEADNIDDLFILRMWKSGDKFIPLGMRKFKKISDFLTDQKISSSEKKDQFLLLNRNNIVWVCGLRIDDRYKITQNTKRAVHLWIK